MEWTICGLTAQPGEKVQGYFAGPDGEKTIPICLIHGTKPGKTVLLTAGVHACEYPGAAAVMELCRELEPSQVSGRLILVPMLNVSSFYERLPFVVKEDGKNLNRMFPGDPREVTVSSWRPRSSGNSMPRRIISLTSTAAMPLNW